MESFDSSGVVTLGVAEPLFKTAPVVMLLALFAGNVTLLLLLLFRLLTALPTLLEGVVEVTLLILQVVVGTTGETLLFLPAAIVLFVLGEFTILFGFVTWETVEVTLFGLVAWVMLGVLLDLFKLFAEEDGEANEIV